MARNLDAKCRQCRREGEKLFLKGEKCLPKSDMRVPLFWPCWPGA